MVELVDRVSAAILTRPILPAMQVSSINLFLTGVSLLCYVHPLYSDPQPPYWMNYATYNPVDHQLHPMHHVQVVPQRYESPITHGSPSHVTQYERRPPTLELSQYQSLPGLANYPERVPETKYLQQKRYYNYHDFVPNNQKQEESKEVNFEEEDTESSLKEKEIMEKLKLLDKLLSEDSSEKDLDTNGIEDKIIPEESKRVVREVRKHKPGFFWTLARVTFETINDTRSAIKQISDIINNNIAPDSVTQASMTSALTAVGSANITGNATSNATETSTTSPETTTQANFVLTRNGLQKLIRRNVLGLVRLFNIEWKDALNQSELNVKEFQKNLNNQVGMYLQDNPNAY
uniref:uncharacterized protein LOC117600278 isoform X1 n=2 Tax=Osmia lignaria TaxID=473952 RepID=UPI00147844DF|nr:uncharacterized protein LOC117600278 isoform X1 [Osmia lignaria]